jgi:outer membrane receptor protein involved in Fe transport
MQPRRGCTFMAFYCLAFPKFCLLVLRSIEFRDECQEKEMAKMKSRKWDRSKTGPLMFLMGIFPFSKTDEVRRDAFENGIGAGDYFHSRIIKRLAIVGVLLTGFIDLMPALCFADPTATDRATPMHLTLDAIVVTGDAVTVPNGTEVGTRKIEKGKNITIPDVIKSEPDIDLKRRALVGDTTDSLAIRGFSGNRIMLNIDGRPVNAAGVVGGYYIDWGTIPLDNIERIELIRGGSSARYGNNALGGVVNVITKKPTIEPTLTFLGTYGGGNGIDSIQNYRLTHTYKIGPRGYSLAGSYQKTDPFLWNNDFEAKNLATSIYLDMPLEGLLTIGFQYANSERGFIRKNRLSDDPDNPDFYRKINDDYPLAFGETFSPYSGTAFIPGPGANWDKTKYYIDFGYLQPICDALLELRLYKNIEDRKEKNYSSNSVNSAYPDGELVLDRDVASDRSYGGSLELSMPWGDHELLLGVERKVLAYGDTDVNYIDMTYNNAPWVTLEDLSFEPSSEGRNWGYYVQDTWRISRRWLLTGGLRYDSYENRSIHGSTSPDLDDEALTPKLTATCKITDADTVTASLYQALRTPGLPETYWWGEGETHGDPVLKPEKNNAAELLYQHNFPKADFLRLSAYYYEVNDYIMFRVDPTWRGVYNIDKVEIYGASLDGRATFTDWLSGTLAVTWQKSKKQGDIYDTAGLFDELDYLPEWKVNAGLEFKLPYQSVFTVTARYVDDRQAIYAYKSGWPAQQYFKLVELDSYITADINLKVPVSRHAEFSCYAENLFDEAYEERFGYPMPGIIVGAALKLSL